MSWSLIRVLVVGFWCGQYFRSEYVNALSSAQVYSDTLSSKYAVMHCQQASINAL